MLVKIFFPPTHFEKSFIVLLESPFYFKHLQYSDFTCCLIIAVVEFDCCISFQVNISIISTLYSMFLTDLRTNQRLEVIEQFRSIVDE